MKSTALSPLASFCGLLMACAAATAAPPGTCQATSPAVPPVVVELYTSEGCSSCPPADRWLSTLKGRPEVLALAFHVTYWDRLGWPDRFATPQATERQYLMSRLAGQSNVYTPQVIAGGKDWRSWPRLPAATALAGAPQVLLVREGSVVKLSVAPAAGSASRWAGYWAVLEDGHESRVKAGENAGETLRHDHVVRLYKPVPAWAAQAGLAATLEVSPGESKTPRRVAFVVTDAEGRAPMQAAVLGC